MKKASISEKIFSDRREIDSLSNVQLIEDVKWDDSNQNFFLCFLVELKVGSEFIPKKSYWYLVFEKAYPFGSIRVFPSVNNSVTVTYQHQNNNAYLNENDLWRDGKLCLDIDIEPFQSINIESSNNKILWYIKRTVLWLEAAVSNKLVNKYSLFELPDFRFADKSTLVFAEDTQSYQTWMEQNVRYGVAELDRYKDKPFIYYVKEFRDINNELLIRLDWGHFLSKHHLKKCKRAIWILLDEVPVLNIWQTPTTFGELKAVFANQKLSLSYFLDKLSPLIRDGGLHHLLIGYPIPKYYYGNKNHITWQALTLPILSYNQKPPNGFRANEIGFKIRDKMDVFTKSRKLNWVNSENWNSIQISQRGRLPQAIARKKILLIGAGCVGSAVAELLVRSNVTNISIFDDDILTMGNLSRHTLGIVDVFSSKSINLSNRLNGINPHAKIISYNTKLSENKECGVKLEDYDIIIDCSGTNKVLSILEESPLRPDVIIMSVSLSLKIRYIYIGLWKHNSLNLKMFVNNISNYLEEDSKIVNELELPRDGIGCWNPTFPGRSDDVWAAAGIAIKGIETFIDDEKKNGITLVYEKKSRNDYFDGFQIVEKKIVSKSE